MSSVKNIKTLSNISSEYINCARISIFIVVHKIYEEQFKILREIALRNNFYLIQIHLFVHIHKIFWFKMNCDFHSNIKNEEKLQ